MSVASDVATATKTAVDTVQYNAASVAADIRKTPSLPPGKTPPAVVVSVGDEGEIERLDALLTLVKYPVAVTLITDGGTKLADNTAVRDWREAVRKKLATDATYSGVSGFNVAELRGKAPFDAAALAAGFNYSTLTATVEVLETRT